MTEPDPVVEKTDPYQENYSHNVEREKRDRDRDRGTYSHALFIFNIIDNIGLLVINKDYLMIICIEMFVCETTKQTWLRIKD